VTLIKDVPSSGINPTSIITNRLVVMKISMFFTISNPYLS
jgi:hypothetical protein